MPTDALRRRLRTAPPRRKIRRLSLTEADYLLFEAIDRHGPLPTHYLYEFTKHLRRDYTHLQNRLTEFYNGDDGGPYLTRPPQQFAGYEARYQHIVYELSERARCLLSEHGRSCAYPPQRGPFVHQLMMACVGASLELSLPNSGLRYISRGEILSRPTCPIETQQSKNPMALPLTDIGQQALIPDDLFGIEYPGVGYRFFAVEVDRGTESVERKNLNQTALGRKVDAYLSSLRQQTYRSWWGIPNLSMLIITTSEKRLCTIRQYTARAAEDRYRNRFVMECERCFGSNWRLPTAVLSSSLSELVGEARV